MYNKYNSNWDCYTIISATVIGIVHYDKYKVIPIIVTLIISTTIITELLTYIINTTVIGIAYMY